jgi:prevent-host-death family protein
MTEVGLREMRQDASELVRRAEAGERITVTVSGRPAAQLVPVDGRQWRTWIEVADVFEGPTDSDWGAGRDVIDDEPRDPWAGR